MTMRKTLMLALTAATLAISAGQALAANPHDGAWSSVEEKSYWSDGKLPKGFKLTINLLFGDNKLEYHSVNSTQPGKDFKTDYLTTLDGTPTLFENQERFNQVSVKQLGADEFQILKMKDGDVIVGEFWTFRPDGKTLVRRGVGKSPEGKSKAYQETFVRR
jgi:hypothetical protein